MTNEQILTKAIEKAIAGGWKDGEAWQHFTMWKTIDTPPSFLWNHDFAKALWGDRLTYVIGNGKPLEGFHALLYPTVKVWQYHLQQMVIADDPIKYIGQNI